MADALALYRLVMGEGWGEELKRAGGGRQAAAARQGRSYRAAGAGQGAYRPRVGRALPRSVMMRAAGSRAAIFKRIRAGGCKTRVALFEQLSYVNDKAELAVSSRSDVLSGERMTEDEKAALVEAWTKTWRGSSKLGFTSHMLLSFPVETDPLAVREIAMDWCAHFFDSALYGDRWEYVLAIHTDRHHPHAHILLNNRGVEHGLWFSCWEGGVMSPQLMREKQAEIAGEYGVALDAMTRLERGIFAKPAGLEEIYAAKAEGRRAEEIALSDRERAMAEAAVMAFAKEYRTIADVLDRADKRHLAVLVRQMTAEIEAGQGGGLPAREEIDMQEIRTVGEAMAYAEERLVQIAAWREGLEGEERVAYETRKIGIVAGFSEMVPDPEIRVRYGSTLEAPWPPAADGALGGEAWSAGVRTAAMNEALASGAEIGLDPDEQRARLVAGGTLNAGLAQDWINRDTAAILRHRGLDPETATLDDRRAAWAAIDAFNDRTAEAVEALQRGQGIELVRTEAQGTEQRAEVVPFPVHEPDRTGTEIEHDGAMIYLRETAASIRTRPLSEMTGRADLDRIEAALGKVLGEEGLEAIRAGRVDRLDEVLPEESARDRIALAQEYAGGLAERSGDDRLWRLARELQAEKIDALAGEIAAQKSAGLAVESLAPNEVRASEALAVGLRASDSSEAQKAEALDLERRPGRDRSLDLENGMEL